MSDVPGGPFRRAAQTVRETVADVWVRFVGNDGEVDIPEGWAHVCNDSEGRPVYGYLGWGNGPQRADLERLAEALRKRYGR